MDNKKEMKNCKYCMAEIPKNLKSALTAKRNRVAMPNLSSWGYWYF